MRFPVSAGNVTPLNVPTISCALNNWNVSPAVSALPLMLVTLKLPPQVSVPRTFTRSLATGGLDNSIVVVLPELSVRLLLNVSAPMELPGVSFAPLARIKLPFTEPFPLKVFPLVNVMLPLVRALTSSVAPLAMLMLEEFENDPEPLNASVPELMSVWPE